MNIFSNKEKALVCLNTTNIKAGEITVYRYYNESGDVESFIVIGTNNGVGFGNYQILSRSKNLIVKISSSYPDVTSLIKGQIYICESGGIYHKVYLDGTKRVDDEIKQGESMYVEDFDTSYTYYVDRHTCKRLDDYGSRVYVSLSSSQSYYDEDNLPSITYTVWKDKDDITDDCTIGLINNRCKAKIDRTKRLITFKEIYADTSTVQVKAIYENNVYSDTWTVLKPLVGVDGADAETYTIIPNFTFIRNSDLLVTEFSILYKCGKDTSYLSFDDLEDLGLTLGYCYSDGTKGIVENGYIDHSSVISKITYCTVVLEDSDGNKLDILTLPVVINSGSITNGQGVYKSLVFCRTNSTPSTPTGGTWVLPLPDSQIESWSQTIPDGSEMLWMTTRIFTSNGESPQEDEWSVPRCVSNSSEIEVKYSTLTDSDEVGTPLSNPENWSSEVTGLANYLAMRVITNGEPETWQVFIIHGINGEDGGYKKYLYISSSTCPSTPIGQNPPGWVSAPSNYLGTWWMSMADFDGSNNIIGSWCEPVRLTGEQGASGKDGYYLTYQYATGKSTTVAPTSGWTSIIPSVSSGYYLWTRFASVTNSNSTPTSWRTPIRLTGERGLAGANTGITFIIDRPVMYAIEDGAGILSSNLNYMITIKAYSNGSRVDISNMLGSYGINEYLMSGKFSYVKSVNNGILYITIKTATVLTNPTLWDRDHFSNTYFNINLTIDGTSYTLTHYLYRLKCETPSYYKLLLTKDVIQSRTEKSYVKGYLESRGGVYTYHEGSKIQDSNLEVMIEDEDGYLSITYDGNDEIEVPEGRPYVNVYLRKVDTTEILDKVTVYYNYYSEIEEMSKDIAAIKQQLGIG